MKENGERKPAALLLLASNNPIAESKATESVFHVHPLFDSSRWGPTTTS